MISELAKPTERQMQVLKFIQRFIESNGVCPTVRDISAGMGIASPNGVMCHLKALRQRGLLDDTGPRRARVIRPKQQPRNRWDGRLRFLGKVK